MGELPEWLAVGIILAVLFPALIVIGDLYQYFRLSIEGTEQARLKSQFESDRMGIRPNKSGAERLPSWGVRLLSLLFDLVALIRVAKLLRRAFLPASLALLALTVGLGLTAHLGAFLAAFAGWGCLRLIARR